MMFLMKKKKRERETWQEVVAQHYTANKWQSRDQPWVFWLETSIFLEAQLTYSCPVSEFTSKQNSNIWKNYISNSSVCS